MNLYVKYRMIMPDGTEYEENSDEGGISGNGVNIPKSFYDRTKQLRSWWTWFFNNHEYNPVVEVYRYIRYIRPSYDKHNNIDGSIWELVFHWPSSKLPH